MLPNKIRMLKELLNQMMMEVGKGNGDCEEAGSEVMETLGGAADGKEIGEEVAEEPSEEKDEDLKETVRSFFKSKPKPESTKGAKVVVGKLAMSKMGDKPAPKGKLKYG